MWVDVLWYMCIQKAWLWMMNRDTKRRILFLLMLDSVQSLQESAFYDICAFKGHDCGWWICDNWIGKHKPTIHGWIKGYRDCNGCLSAVSYMGPQQAGSQRPGEPISLVVFLMRGCGSYNYQLLASVLCEISYIFGQIISYYQRFHPKLGSSITHLSPAHFRHWEYIILLVGKLTVRWQPLEND